MCSVARSARSLSVAHGDTFVLVTRGWVALPLPPLSCSPSHIPKTHPHTQCHPSYALRLFKRLLPGRSVNRMSPAGVTEAASRRTSSTVPTILVSVFHHFVSKTCVEWAWSSPCRHQPPHHWPPEKQVLVLYQFWLRTSTGSQKQETYKLLTNRYEVHSHFAVCTLIQK